MTLKEYQEFASKGILPAGQGKNGAIHFALGLAGETGEVCDIIKKREFHGRDIPVEDIKKELGDVMWYVANLCNAFHFSIEDVIADNVQKLTKRYGEVYQSSIEEVQSMTKLTPTGKIVCNKCGSYDVSYVSAGPHIKAMCKHCGAFIKFVSKDEFAKMNYGTDEDCPF